MRTRAIRKLSLMRPRLALKFRQAELFFYRKHTFLSGVGRFSPRRYTPALLFAHDNSAGRNGRLNHGVNDFVQMVL